VRRLRPGCQALISVLSLAAALLWAASGAASAREPAGSPPREAHAARAAEEPAGEGAPGTAAGQSPPGQAGAAAPAALALELTPGAGGGTPLHAELYRPEAQTSGGVLLVQDWGEDGRACWLPLAAALTGVGFEVLVPSRDCPEEQAGAGQDTRLAVPAAARASATTLAAELCGWLAESPNAWAVVCVGRAGLTLAELVRKVEGVAAWVWVAPPSTLDADRLELPEGDERCLILAAATDPAALRVAEDLFTRLAPRAELRLFGRGEGGCALTAVPAARTGIVEWLFASMPAREFREWPAVAERKAPGTAVPQAR
jgi:hypothetical protein